MNLPQAAMAWCPFPDRQVAREISGTLIEEGLIACANIIGEVEAIFSWQGERSSAIECGVLFKTNADKLEPLIERLGVLHPYDTPAISAWYCDAGHPATLEWLAALSN